MAPRVARSLAPQHFHSSSGSSSRKNEKRKSRAQDAFALASKENPDHVKVRQHRLGESELDADEPRRKRQRMLDEVTDDEDEPVAGNAQRRQQKKVNKGERGPGGFDEGSISSGSDGEGNHWRAGPGEESEGDESVDSEEAFGESDEERFEDFTFRGSKGNQIMGQKKASRLRSHDDPGGVNLSEGEGEDRDSGNEDDSDDSLGSDAIDLATALDQFEEDEAEEMKSNKKDKAKKHTASMNAGLEIGNELEDQLLPEGDLLREVDDNDSGDESNDSSVDSELEIKAKPLTHDNSGSDDMDWLRNFDSKAQHVERDDKKSRAQSNMVSHTWNGLSDESDADRPSEHIFETDDEDDDSSRSEQGEVAPSSSKSLHDIANSFSRPDDAVSSDDDLNPDDFKPGALMRLLEDDERKEKGLGPLPKNAKRRGDDLLLEPLLPPRQQDKLDRSVAYKKAKETLDRWQETVKRNRRAEHLHFPIVDPEERTPMGKSKMQSADTSQPRNELENTIEDILQQSGLAKRQKDADGLDSKPSDDLPRQEQPTLREEIDRRNELRKARDMLFREEQRAKRIKKIKSKAYRRVHRKERERDAQKERDLLAAEGLEMSENEREKNDRRRAEERMGGRHKNSRWAKSVKATGRAAWDEDARDGIAEMARKHEELNARMTGRDADRDAGESSDSIGSEDEEEQEFQLRDDIDQLDSETQAEPKNGIAALAFMQRADEAQRKRNDETIRQLKRDVNGGESESEPEVNLGRRVFGPTISNDRKGRAKKQRNEFEEPMSSEEDADLENQVEKGKGTIPSQTFTSERPFRKPNGLSKLPPVQVAGTVSASSTETFRASPTFSSALKSPQRPNQPQQVSNDTMEPQTIPKTSSEAVKALLKNPASSKAVPNLGNETSAPSYDASHQHTALQVDKTSPEDDERCEGVNDTAHSLNTTQEQLMRAAFGIDDSADATFAAEKKAAEESEDERYEPTALPGWGSWAGAGLSKREEEQAQKRRLQSMKKAHGGISKDKRKDKNRDKVILSEKKPRKNNKYLASELPHPFESRAQYERSLRLPLGKEWNTKESFQKATKPRVMVKQGIIAPMRKPLV